jgi:hypothetical protein
MTYDADPAYREKRRGLRWYTVVAFLSAGHVRPPSLRSHPVAYQGLGGLVF